MAKLMWIAGILFAAAGLALGVIVLLPTAAVGGLTLDAAAVLLVGGVLAIGLGSVIDALHHGAGAGVSRPADAVPPPAVIPEFDPRAAKAEVAAAVPAPLAEEVSAPTRETIRALDDARKDIERAFETTAPAPEAEAPAAAADTEAEEAAVVEPPAEGQLYVIDERIIRERPARILSDGTVEAETGDGWMRFENLEHLDEYLDAMEEQKA